MGGLVRPFEGHAAQRDLVLQAAEVLQLVLAGDVDLVGDHVLGQGRVDQPALAAGVDDEAHVAELVGLQVMLTGLELDRARGVRGDRQFVAVDAQGQRGVARVVDLEGLGRAGAAAEGKGGKQQPGKTCDQNRLPVV
ncbi:hypothetical protein D3C71_1779790 [compost metagenome]